MSQPIFIKKAIAQQFLTGGQRCVIVEQTDEKLFNRGILLNIGYLETDKMAYVSCYTFHDVDILPIGDCDYSCKGQPRAMAVYLSRWNFTRPSWPGFGGVIQLKTRHLKKTNGHPVLVW